MWRHEHRKHTCALAPLLQRCLVLRLELGKDEVADTADYAHGDVRARVVVCELRGREEALHLCGLQARLAQCRLGCPREDGRVSDRLLAARGIGEKHAEVAGEVTRGVGDHAPESTRLPPARVGLAGAEGEQQREKREQRVVLAPVQIEVVAPVVVQQARSAHDDEVREEETESLAPQAHGLAVEGKGVAQPVWGVPDAHLTGAAVNAHLTGALAYVFAGEGRVRFGHLLVFHDGILGR
mmetsp:Transcript_20480/g.43936  ORF Transcript_20480/g.43936 Transcript_20480/m.43936 type:complete len:239 (-) Transcript_20480:29-745(-)